MVNIASYEEIDVKNWTVCENYEHYENLKQ